MITSEKLAVYLEFGGDDDALQRCGSPKRGGIENGDWVVIRNLLQELTMQKRNLVSPGYAELIRQRLSETTADRVTAQALLEMA